MQPRRNTRRLLLVLVFALALAACGGPSAPPADTAVTVNGQAVPMASYSVLVSASQQKVGQVGIPVNWTTPDGERRLAAFQVNALRQVVKNAVIGQLASERKIAVSDDELTRALGEIEAALGGPEAFEGQLTQDGLSREEFASFYRFTLLDRLLRRADPGYPAALEQALAEARVQAFVGPCATNHQYPRCLDDS